MCSRAGYNDCTRYRYLDHTDVDTRYPDHVRYRYSACYRDSTDYAHYGAHTG